MTRLIFFPVFIPLIYIVEGFLHKTKHTMTGTSKGLAISPYFMLCPEAHICRR